MRLEDICYGALAARDEEGALGKAKKRTLHGATKIGLNQWIRQHIKHKGDCPLGCDAAHAFAVSTFVGVLLALLIIDARKAHRRLKLHRKDLRYVCARIQEARYANLAHTYGVGSADLAWRRLLGLIGRRGSLLGAFA